MAPAFISDGNTRIADTLLDFYCDEVRLCVEVDGEVHALYRRHQDQQRDETLQKESILTLRISNSELALDPVGVLERITNLCFARAGQFPHIKNQGVL